MESGVKGIKFFIEWFPDRFTGEIKILTKRGSELAIAKWIVDPKTGEAVGSIINTHGKGQRVLPGVASSTLKKLLPRLTQEMTKNLERLGAKSVLTTLADPAITNGRLGLQRPPVTGGWGYGVMYFNAISMFFCLENTMGAEEPTRPEYRDLDPIELGLSEQDIFDLAEFADGPPFNYGLPRYGLFPM